MSFSYSQLQRLIPTTVHPSFSYFRPETLRQRTDSFRSLLPCVPLATPSYTVEFLETLTTSPADPDVYSRLETFAYALASSPVTPQAWEVNPTRMTREIRFEGRTAELLGAWEGEFLRLAEAELEAMFSTALLYGGRAPWDGWPGNLLPNLEGMSFGLDYLSENVSLTTDPLVPLCSYDFGEEQFSLDAFAAAWSRVPLDRPWYFVVNQDLLTLYYHLWDREYKQSPPMVTNPVTGGLVPTYAGLPILVNNFLATSLGETPHPEGSAGCTSIYLLSPRKNSRQEKGLFCLCPKEWGRPYSIEFVRPRDAEDALALRLHLEFGLAFSSPADFFRVKNIRLFPAPNP